MVYDEFCKVGIVVLKCNFVRVWVNGELLGVFINVEFIKKLFLVCIFGDDDGNFYEV